jgi:tetratricopeptide (TPR) repeat protein
MATNSETSIRSLFLLFNCFLVYGLMNGVAYSAGTPTQSTTGDQSPVISTQGDVTIHYGVSKEVIDELSKNLKLKNKAMERLLQNLDEKEVALGERETKLRELAQKYKELEGRLAKRPPEDDLASEATQKLEEGDLTGAEELLKKSLDRNLKIIAEKRKEAAADAFELGSLKELQLEYQEAKGFYEQAVLLESENSEYLNTFGILLAAIGEPREAITYYNKAVKINLKAFGENDPDVARGYNNIGEAWRALGEFKKAIDQYNKALKADLAVFGDHPKVATYYNNLGAAWGGLGDTKKAIDYYDRAIKIDLVAFGENHIKVAIDYNNLGAASAALGDSKKAIEYYSKALQIDLKVFGENHPDVATDYNNIGAAWDILGESKKAIDYYNKAIQIDSSAFGENHPNVGVSYNNLGAAWDNLGESEKAIEHYSKAFEIFTSVYGDDHPSTLEVQSNLDDVRAKQTVP